jgi:hypothetical protein
MENTRQSGQIGIIIILIMVVLLTFGLSIASRSTREIALSQQEEESNRVFNAAEAGVERALATNLDFQGEQLDAGGVTIPGTDSSLNYTIRKNRILETRLVQGTTAMVKLQDATYPLSAQVYIDWAKDSDCNAARKPATLIVSVYNTNAGVNTVRHLTYAACNHNNDIPIAAVGQNGYYRRATVNTQVGDQFMRIKTVFNDTYVRVSAGSTLPTQAYDIRSDADSNLGNETRAVQVKRTLSVAPSIMDYALFSDNILSK